MLPAGILEYNGKFYEGIKEGEPCVGCAFKDDSIYCDDEPCCGFSHIKEVSYSPVHLHIDLTYKWLLVVGTSRIACSHKPKKVGERSRTSYRIGADTARIQLVNIFFNISIKDTTGYGTLYKIVRNRKKEVIGFICQDNTKN